MNRASDRLFWALLLLGGLALYGPGLTTPRFGDDLAFVQPEPVRPFYNFATTNPTNSWYRPLETALLGLIQLAAGRAVWPVHLLALLLHFALVGVVWAIARELTDSGPVRRAAALGCLVSQGAVMAVASPDTFSQQLAALGITITAWQAWRWLGGGGRRALGGALAAAALALWGKESGLAVVPVTLGVVLCRVGDPAARRRSVVLLISLAALGVAYGLARGQVVSELPQLGSTGYGFAFGANIPQNLAALWLAIVSPISTVSVVRWQHEGAHLAFGLAALPGLVLLAGLLGYSGPDRRRGLALLGLAGVALFPTALLHHVSELYAYQALPWLALGLGLTVARAPRGWLGVLLLAALGHGLAVEDKVAAMRTNGERCARWLQQLEPLAAELPAHAEIVLADDSADHWRYAVFALPGLQVFRHATSSLPAYFGRPDLSFALVDAPVAPDPQRWVVSPGPGAGPLVVTSPTGERWVTPPAGEPDDP